MCVCVCLCTHIWTFFSKEKTYSFLWVLTKVRCNSTYFLVGETEDQRGEEFSTKISPCQSWTFDIIHPLSPKCVNHESPKI